MFRHTAFVECFVRKMAVLFGKSTRFSKSLYLTDKTVSEQLTISLFLLPAVLSPSSRFEFRGKLFTNFISVCPTVKEMVCMLCQRYTKIPDWPFVGIIGRLMAPSAYVVYYQKKVYKCTELWHAVDMAVKIYFIYQKKFPSDAVSSWQFILLYFYNLDNEGRFVLPDVHKLRTILKCIP